jgi:mono/diheme cytochrome c family protein
MKTWKKIALGVASLLVVTVASASAFVSLSWDRRYDDVSGPDLKVVSDSATIARGEYLVRGPAHCSTCHVGSFEEWGRADAGEQLPLRGGVRFEMGPMGALSTANLTPDSATGIGRYTDRQLFRMMRHNLKPDGTASLWVLMPFFMMADEDLVAIVSYLRSQPAVRNEVEPPRYTAMGKALRSVMPAFKPRLDHAAPVTAPTSAPTKERGEYLARYVANCVGCHTNHDIKTMQFIGPEFAGGANFPTPPGTPGSEEGLTFRSPNLTPDPTGVLVRIGSKDAWIRRFRQGRVYKGSPMHWGPFSRMSDVDLEALWLFFNSLAPVPNDVGQTAFRAEAGKD